MGGREVGPPARGVRIGVTASSSQSTLCERLTPSVAAITGFMLVIGSALSAAYGVPFIRSASALLLPAFFLVHAVTTRGVRRLTLFHLLSVVLFAMMAAGILYSRSPVYGAVKTAFFLLYWVLFGVAFFAVLTKTRHVVTFLAGIGVGGLAYVVFLWAFRGDPFSILAEAGTFFRLILGGIQNPIWLARDMGLVAILCLWFLYDRPIGRLSLLAAPALPMVLGDLVATGSKGPFIATVLAGGLFLGLRGGRVARVSLAVVACALLVTLIVVPDSVYLEAIAGRRIGRTEGTTSVEVRTGALDASLEEFTSGSARAMLVGRGTGDFSHLSKGVDVRDYPHNIFLEVMYEQGLLGLILLAGLVIVPLISGWRLLRPGGSRLPDGARGLATVALSLCVFATLNALVSGDLLANELVPISGVALVALAHAPRPGDKEPAL